jgi:hypothetical protein
MEAARIDGAVQSALTGDLGLKEVDTGLLLYDRVLFEPGTLMWEIGAIVRAAAFFAG